MSFFFKVSLLNGYSINNVRRCYEPTLPENVILYDKGRLTRQKKILSAKGFQAVFEKRRRSKYPPSKCWVVCTYSENVVFQQGTHCVELLQSHNGESCIIMIA